jgi:transcriptional regulator with XRE-family HTH domain
MSETQKNTISKLLKERGRTKRELATFLDIHENGINRLIGNSKISMERLEQIARFLDMNMKTLFDKIYPKPVSADSLTDVSSVHDKIYDNDVEEIIVLLSEVVKGQKMIREIEEENGQKLSDMMSLIVSSLNK